MSRSLICSVLLSAAAVFAGCTDFVERTQVKVVIDAEPRVRERVRYVDVEVRSGSVEVDAWKLTLSTRLLARSPQAWPLSFKLPPPEAESNGYLITAVAKDADDETLTVVRAIGAYVPGKMIELPLSIDEACVLRKKPCPATFTCSDGQCVNPGVTPDEKPADGARMPVAGSNGSDSAGSAAPGCAGEKGCGAPVGCQGGGQACDPPLGCATRDDQGVCQACPAGFMMGPSDECLPALSALAAEGGRLEPAFDPGESSYLVRVPLLQDRVKLTLQVPDAAEATVNGVDLGSDRSWTSASLPLGDTSVVITLSAPGRKSRSYNVTLRREAAQRAQSTAAESGPGDQFGRSVALSGDRLVVGAPYEDGDSGSRAGMPNEGAANSGAVYVFEREGERWVQKDYLKAENPRAGARFGFFVALEGDTLAVSAPEDSGGGAIYMFEWEGGGFHSKGVLRGGKDGVLLGRSIALQRDRLIAGAPGDDTGTTESGSIYVFERTDGEWKYATTLRPTAPTPWEFLGSGVALDGDTVVGGATARSVGGVTGGAAFVFQRSGQGWDELQMLSPGVSETGAFFGENISISGDTIAIGAFNGTAGLTGGSVCLYQRGGDGKFGPPMQLRPTNSRSGDLFGLRVLLRGDTLLIAAPHESSGNGGIAADGGGMAVSSGSVYLFSRERGGWHQLTQIKPQLPAAREEFGYGLSLSGDSFVVGAPADVGGDGSSNATGAFYVFR